LAASRAAPAGEAVNEVETFLGETADYIRRHGLLVGGETVVAGVSGGADSVALGEVLRRRGGCSLRVAHVHHGLRADADADAEFVADLTRRWGVPLDLERIDTPALARSTGAGLEEAARRGRYDALRAVAVRAGAAVVAVAHHADDQVETVLHRIVRGTHLRGLAGMPPQRPLGDGVRLVRPLLWARRRQIEDFCRSAGLQWRTDHTNLQTDFTRNFLRHELLPLLRRRLNLRADEAVLRLASAARQTEDALDALAQRLLHRACRKRSPHQIVLRLAPLRKAPAPVAATAIRAALAEINAPEQDLSNQRYADLLALLEGKAAAVDLPGGIRAERRGTDLRLTAPGSDADEEH